MDSIRQWAFSLCVAMAAGGIAQMLMPKSGLEKIFRLTVSAFFLCCLLSPFVFRMPLLELDVKAYEQESIDQRAKRLTDTVGHQTEQVAKQDIEKIIAEKLAEMGIKYHRITININTNGQNNPEVKTVEIELDRVHQREHDHIRKELTGTFGLDFRLGYVTGGEG